MQVSAVKRNKTDAKSPTQTDRITTTSKQPEESDTKPNTKAESQPGSWNYWNACESYQHGQGLLKLNQVDPETANGHHGLHNKTEELELRPNSKAEGHSCFAEGGQNWEDRNERWQGV